MLKFKNKTHTCILLLFLFLWLMPGQLQSAFAQSPAQTFAESSAVNPEKCAVVIIDLKNKKVVDSHNAKLPLVPASINKALTIASTLTKSDLNYRYHTKVFLGGKVDEGILNGNLIIEGGGDPTLGTKQGPSNADFIQDIVKALKKKKVNIISGKIVIDADVFPGSATIPTWHPGDLAHSYGTGCHGFNWQHNASGKSAVKDPQSKFRTQLISALNREGIEVNGDEFPVEKRGKAVVDFKSEPISEIMRYCMMQSDNLYAEAFLRTLAMLSDKDATPDNGAELELKYWKKKGSPVQEVKVFDGSGLSRSNRLTAEFLADVLVKMAKDADYVSFFPMAGVEGTVKSFLKDTPLEDYIALKTGSMNGIQCYAGYKLDDEYAPTHVVVVMINELPQGRPAAKNAVKKMLIDTFEKQ
ncbi:MAG: D-alanyl-D-alanine carboxypeptidase [Prevotella sp.]|nr:D-alanyl-D-alanine carboxypeptidase [Prevotella sp.]MCM1075327.1 D-alanyl-D-alanine carboxypeptidase [Ruminococcus sp.]